MQSMCTKPAKDPASENPSMDGEGHMESHAWMRNDWQVMSTREGEQDCFGDEKLSRLPEDGPVVCTCWQHWMCSVGGKQRVHEFGGGGEKWWWRCGRR